MRPTAITIRFNPQKHADLALIARVLGTTVTHVVRESVDATIDKTISEPTFRAKLDQLQAEERALVERQSP